MAKKGEFYFVHYLGYEDRVHDEIVLLSNVRLVNMREGPSIEGVERWTLPVPFELVDWIDSHEAEAQLNKIQEKSKLLSLSVR